MKENELRNRIGEIRETSLISGVEATMEQMIELVDEYRTAQSLNELAEMELHSVMNKYSTFAEYLIGENAVLDNRAIANLSRIWERK